MALRDGYEVRPGQPISVQPAHFERRDDVDAEDLARRKASAATAKEEAAMRKKQRLLDQKSLSEWDAGLISGKRTCTVLSAPWWDAAARRCSADEVALAPPPPRWRGLNLLALGSSWNSLPIDTEMGLDEEVHCYGS